MLYLKEYYLINLLAKLALHKFKANRVNKPCLFVCFFIQQNSTTQYYVFKNHKMCYIYKYFNIFFLLTLFHDSFFVTITAKNVYIIHIKQIYTNVIHKITGK